MACLSEHVTHKFVVQHIWMKSDASIYTWQHAEFVYDTPIRAHHTWICCTTYMTEFRCLDLHVAACRVRVWHTSQGTSHDVVQRWPGVSLGEHNVRRRTGVSRGFEVQKKSDLVPLGPHMGVEPILWNCGGSRSYESHENNLDKTTETELICYPPLRHTWICRVTCLTECCQTPRSTRSEARRSDDTCHVLRTLNAIWRCHLWRRSDATCHMQEAPNSMQNAPNSIILFTEYLVPHEEHLIPYEDVTYEGDQTEHVTYKKHLIPCKTHLIP